MYYKYTQNKFLVGSSSSMKERKDDFLVNPLTTAGRLLRSGLWTLLPINMFQTILCPTHYCEVDAIVSWILNVCFLERRKQKASGRQMGSTVEGSAPEQRVATYSPLPTTQKFSQPSPHPAPRTGQFARFQPLGRILEDSSLRFKCKEKYFKYYMGLGVHVCEN